MGLFGKILDKLGFNKAEAAPAPTSTATAGGQGGTATTATPGSTTPPAQTQTQAQPQAQPQGQPQTSAQPQAKSMVDVVAELEQRAAANPQKLNWRTSIVDLLKLLDMDSSLEARKELAVELDCPQNLMGDSAQMNMWLHKTVLQRIAANGGNVPADLLN